MIIITFLHQPQLVKLVLLILETNINPVVSYQVQVGINRTIKSSRIVQAPRTYRINKFKILLHQPET